MLAELQRSWGSRSAAPIWPHRRLSDAQSPKKRQKSWSRAIRTPAKATGHPSKNNGPNHVAKTTMNVLEWTSQNPEIQPNGSRETWKQPRQTPRGSAERNEGISLKAGLQSSCCHAYKADPHKTKVHVSTCQGEHNSVFHLYSDLIIKRKRDVTFLYKTVTCKGKKLLQLDDFKEVSHQFP